MKNKSIPQSDENITAPGKKIVGYCRVSTENQKEEGTIGLQETASNQYAANHGYELIELFKDEGVSGGLENRPALIKLIDCLEERKDVAGVLIYKLDRLARDLYIQEHLIKKFEGLNKVLISIKEPNLESSDPMRKAFRQFMGIVSELEKAFITMRLSAGRINKAQKGGYAGGSAALGYKVRGKKLTVDKKSSETVRQVQKMKRQGKSLHEIARILNKNGIPTARGGKWYAGTVKYILENPIYRGVLHYKTERAERLDLAIR